MTENDQGTTRRCQGEDKARAECEYCDKPGHTESEFRTLQGAIAELKKENAKKTVGFTTATPAEVEEDK